jgi:hypothetical protein
VLRLHREVVDDSKIVGIDETTTTIAATGPVPRPHPPSHALDGATIPDRRSSRRLTAYILAQNKLIDAKAVINAQTLPRVQMPNRNGFIPRFPERIPK